jgi:hypothetical protein
MKKNHAFSKGKFLSATTNIVAQNSSKVSQDRQSQKCSTDPKSVITPWIDWQCASKVILPLVLSILQFLQPKPVSGCVETVRRIRFDDFEVEQSRKICYYPAPPPDSKTKHE